MKKDYSLTVTPPTEMRRSEFACDDDWIKFFLINSQVGYVGTRWDDQPFITPLVFWFDPQKHEIYFHTNLTGRMKANSERDNKVCFVTSRVGYLLPSNVALEFSVQYESVVVFGLIKTIENIEQKKYALQGLVNKYFESFEPGELYRPITDRELKQTNVYAIEITEWSGKRNWPEIAEQSSEWTPLPIELLKGWSLKE